MDSITLKSPKDIVEEVMSNKDFAAKCEAISEYVSRGQAGAYVRNHLRKNIACNTVDKECTQRTIDILSKFEVKYPILFTQFIPISVGSKMVNTFTCAEALSVAGYSSDYVSDGPKYHLRSGNPTNRSGGPCVKFSKGGVDCFVPVDDKNLNTNYAPKVDGVEYAPFNGGIAASVAAVCSYAIVKRGETSAIVVNPAVRELTGLDKMVNMAVVVATIDTVVAEMRQVDTYRGVTRDYTFRGTKLASEVYNFLISEMRKEGSDVIGEWLENVNLAINQEKGRKFFDIQEHDDKTEVVIDYLPARVPHSIGGINFDYRTQKASLMQAWTALSVSRGIRGENDSEASVNSRFANLPFRTSYQANEFLRVRNDYERFITGQPKIVIWSQKGEVTITSQILAACLMIGYSGVVYINSELAKLKGIKTVVDEKKEMVDGKEMLTRSAASSYRESKFTVEFYRPLQELSEYIKQDDLVIDVSKPIPMGGTFETYNQKMSDNIPDILAMLDKMNCKYVLPVRMYANIDSVLLKKEGERAVQCRWLHSGTQFSNLVAYITNFECDTYQEYDLNTMKGREMWFAATILVNVARNTYNVTALPPNFLLEDCKFPMIRQKVSGLGLVTANIHTYDLIDREVISRYTTEELYEAMNMSTDVAKTAVMQNELAARMNDGEDGGSSSGLSSPALPRDGVVRAARKLALDD